MPSNNNAWKHSLSRVFFFSFLFSSSGKDKGTETMISPQTDHHSKQAKPNEIKAAESEISNTRMHFRQRQIVTMQMCVETLFHLATNSHLFTVMHIRKHQTTPLQQQHFAQLVGLLASIIKPANSCCKDNRLSN